MNEKLRALLREPLVHFLLAGAGIYGLYAGVAGSLDSEDERTIVVSAAEVAALSDQWTRLWQRPPTEEELAGIVRESIRTQALYREAVAMDLENGDIVVERRLAQKLESLAQSLLAPGEPSEDELHTWFEENEEEFKQPDRYSLIQVYFNPDQRGAGTLDDAKAVFVKLRSIDGIPADIDSYGDRLMSRSYFQDQTELDLSNLFGLDFVDEVVTLEPGTWHGPILSGYGPHLVYVTEVTRAPTPEYSGFAEQVREGWTAEKVADLREQFVENLVAQYEITIEDSSD